MLPQLVVGADLVAPDVRRASAESSEPLAGLRQFIERKDARIRQLEAELERLRNDCVSVKSELAKPPAATEYSSGEPSRPDVCAKGCQFSDLSKAVRAAAPGDTIAVAPEVNGSCAVIDKPLRLVGLKAPSPAGTRAHLAGGVCMGKAPLVVKSAGVTIEGFEISGVSVPSRNGACIRFDPGAEDVVLRDLLCRDSQDGLLGRVKGTLLIEDSRFEGNGFDNGQAHGLYVWGGELIIRNSQILSTRHGGHSLKAKARRMLVEDSILAALGSRNSRAIDAFGGGQLVLRRNVIQQGPNSDNNEMLGIALESRRLLPDGHSVLLEDNWLIYDDPARRNRRVIAGRKLGPWKLRGNVMVGVTALGGTFDENGGNRWFPERTAAGLPPWDGSVNSLPRPGAKAPSGGDVEPPDRP